MKGYIELLQTTNPFILIILHVIMIIFARYIIGFTSFITPWGRKITANEQKTVWDKILMGICRKIFGTDAGGNLRGRYQVEGYGEAVINLRVGQPPYIHVLTTTERVLIINRKTPEETVELYETLLQAWQESY